MLYQHQVDGAAWLVGRSRAYLGDRPGLGKTRTILAALDGTRPLIVCPAIVRTHWARESEVTGTLPQPDALFIRSYDEVTRGGTELMKKLIGKHGVDTLVLDEAHYLKHANSKRTKTLLGINGYARRLPRVYAASGTPVPKNPSELWTILSSLFPHVCVEHGLKNFRQFVERFCVSRLQFVRGAATEKFLAEIRNEEEFKAILGKIMLARTLDDVGIDVPELDWQITRFDIEQHPIIIDPDTAAASSDIKRALAQGVALADIANDPHVARMRRRLGELKIAPVAEMLSSQLADGDEKIVVFAHHTNVLHGLRVLLKNFGVAYIDGETGPTKRQGEIDRFANDARCRVFIGQNIACGTGTDGLQKSGARRAVLVEPDWSAYQNDQLGKRLARIGGQERCVAQMIALAGTLDEAIVATNHKEVLMAERIGLGSNHG